MVTTTSDHVVVSTHAVGSSISIAVKKDGESGHDYACISPQDAGLMWKETTSGSNFNLLYSTADDKDVAGSMALIPGEAFHNTTHTCFQGGSSTAHQMCIDLTSNVCSSDGEDVVDIGTRRALLRSHMFDDDESSHRDLQGAGLPLPIVLPIPIIP